jgi:hypothetical protein
VSGLNLTRQSGSLSVRASKNSGGDLEAEGIIRLGQQLHDQFATQASASRSPPPLQNKQKVKRGASMLGKRLLFGIETYQFFASRQGTSRSQLRFCSAGPSRMPTSFLRKKHVAGIPWRVAFGSSFCLRNPTAQARELKSSITRALEAEGIARLG